MSTIIGLKQLREHTGEVTKRVQKGEDFIVFRRSTPLFRLVPVDESAAGSQELRDWTTQAIDRWRPALEKLADE